MVFDSLTWIFTLFLSLLKESQDGWGLLREDIHWKMGIKGRRSQCDGWNMAGLFPQWQSVWTQVGQAKTEQQETGRTYYPMKLLERDSSKEKTKKEQSQ